MKCCKKELEKKKKFNAELHTVAFEYLYCKKCKRIYDKDKNEIVIKGMEYRKKKDCVDPFL